MSYPQQEHHFESRQYSDDHSQKSNVDSLPLLGKRRRVALACGNCRQRKSRCDGGRPKCSLCNELGCECLYEQSGTTSNLTVGKSYISRLEQRLENIEETLKGMQNPRNENIQSISYSNFKRDELLPGNNETAREEVDIASHITFLPVGSGNSEVGENNAAEDSIDGMGAIKFTDEEDCGYFGPSSNIAFVGHISRAMIRGNNNNPIVPSPPNRARVATGLMSVSRPYHALSGKTWSGLGDSRGSINIYALPAESQALALITKYFLKTGQLLPFIHEQSFRETYIQMNRNNRTMVRRTWLALLNIIFAMAVTLSIDRDMSAEKRIEESDMYYQRANLLCDKESRQTISVELVQYLLIQGQYLQGTQKSVQAWTVHGLAITAAFQLGLHSPQANHGFSALECETRKRVWFGCILLDRTFSMTFGRPSIIPETYIKTDPPNILIQFVGNVAQSKPSTQIDAIFYSTTINLYKVMYQVIDSCYGQNLGFQDSSTAMEAVSLVLTGERQLEEWQQTLSPVLCLRTSDAPLDTQALERMDHNNESTERFSLVLTLRFHNLRILLHRPFLEKFLDANNRDDSDRQTTEDKILQQVGVNSVQTCVESAKLIISIVHTVVLSTGWHRDLLGAWNYSLFYTFNAGLVIFAALLVAPSDSNANSPWSFAEQARPYLNMAIESLRNLDHGNRVIERCVQYLSQLSLALLRQTSSDMMLDYGLFSSGPFNTQKSPLAASQQVQQMKQLPIDIDLSEFMTNTNMDFFGEYFDVS